MTVGRYTLHHADVLEALRAMPDASFDAVLSDVPYGLGSREPTADELVAYLTGAELALGGDFMGKKWNVPSVAVWRELLRVLKPGAPVLAFAGSKTQDLIGIGMRAAGFELRDCIMWMYAQGWGKGLAIDKAIDERRDDLDAIRNVTAFVRAARDRAGKSNAEIDAAFGTNGMAGHWTSSTSQPAVPSWEQWEALKAFLSMDAEMDAEVWRLNGRKGTPGDDWAKREVVGRRKMRSTLESRGGFEPTSATVYSDIDVTRAATEASAAWEGWNTALAPSYEPCILAMKPLDGTFASNALAHGVAGINVDGCRIATDWSERSEAWKRSGHSAKPDAEKIAAPPGVGITCHPLGRWPKNVVMDEGAAALLDAQSGILHTHGGAITPEMAALGYGGGSGSARYVPPSKGGASTMFFVAKASRAEREFGCEHLAPRPKTATLGDGMNSATKVRTEEQEENGVDRGDIRNHGPCIKPLKLVKYLATLIQPPKRAHAPRRILIPYAGTGSEMIGALRAGWEEVVGIEREGPEGENYLAIAHARLARWSIVPEWLDEGEAVSGAVRAVANQLGLFGGGE